MSNTYDIMLNAIDAHLKVIKDLEVVTEEVVRMVMTEFCARHMVNFWSGMGGYGILLPYVLEVDECLYCTDNDISRDIDARKIYLPDDFGMINRYDPTGWYEELLMVSSELRRLPGSIHILSCIGDITVVEQTTNVITIGD